MERIDFLRAGNPCTRVYHAASTVSSSNNIHTQECATSIGRRNFVIPSTHSRLSSHPLLFRKTRKTLYATNESHYSTASATVINDYTTLYSTRQSRRSNSFSLHPSHLIPLCTCLLPLPQWGKQSPTIRLQNNTLYSRSIQPFASNAERERDIEEKKNKHTQRSRR